MERKTAKDFDPGLLELYDFYAHGMITKRQFLDGAGKFATVGVTATALFTMMQPNYAWAEQINFNDPDIIATYEKYDSPNGQGEMEGYMVRPVSATGKLPAVLVIHENRGLNPYIKDLARRLAKAGYMAFAPDGLYPQGGYPGNDAEGKVMQKNVDRAALMNDFFAAFEYLMGHDGSTGKVGAVGFCYGGGVCNALAVAYPEMPASVPYYGRQAAAADVPAIKAAMMLHYGGLDKRVNAGWPAYEAALKAHGTDYQAFIYADANHGFHNDSTARYDEAQAKLSWDRTLEHFGRHLS